MRDVLISMGFFAIGIAFAIWRRNLAEGHAAFQRGLFDNTQMFDEHTVRRTATAYGLVGAAMAVIAMIALVIQLGPGSELLH